MYELVYTSVAQSDFSDAELAALLSQSRENNARLGISGLLLYANREFVQLLEGEEHSVQSLYQGIRQDPRHTSVEVLHEGPIDVRAFAQWSMAFRAVENINELSAAQGFEHWDFKDTPRNTLADAPNLGKELLLAFRKLL